MKRHTLLIFAALLVVAGALAGCKSSGIAVTPKGQVLEVNILHPKDLPNAGEDNLDIHIGNRGVRDIHDILVEVQIPPELTVTDQTNERGVTVMHDPSSNVYSFTIGNLNVAETTNLRFHVRTNWTATSTEATVKATAWQRDLPGESNRVIQTAVIKVRQ
jgi:hypothetical protein